MLAMNTTTKAKYASQAFATCTYRMRTTLPIAASGGDQTRAIQRATNTATTLAAPRKGRARSGKVVFAVVLITRELQGRWEGRSAQGPCLRRSHRARREARGSRSARRPRAPARTIGLSR